MNSIENLSKTISSVYPKLPPSMVALCAAMAMVFADENAPTDMHNELAELMNSVTDRHSDTFTKALTIFPASLVRMLGVSEATEPQIDTNSYEYIHQQATKWMGRLVDHEDCPEYLARHLSDGICEAYNCINKGNLPSIDIDRWMGVILRDRES